MKLVLRLSFALFAVVFVGFALYVAARQNLKFKALLPSIAASSDSAVIALRRLPGVGRG